MREHYDCREAEDDFGENKVDRPDFDVAVKLKEKSVLDGLVAKVREEPFAHQPIPPPEDRLEIVGHCQTCGAPVYGKKMITANETNPTVRYACTCWRKQGTIQQNMETK